MGFPILARKHLYIESGPYRSFWYDNPCCDELILGNITYPQVSNISRTLVGNEIVHHSDVVGASPVGVAPNYIFILDLTPGFIGLGKDNCKTRRETFKFGSLVCLILEILRYLHFLPFINTEMMQIVETLPCGRQGAKDLAILHSQYYGA